MKHLKPFLHSFLDWKTILTTFAIDFVIFALIFGLFLGYGSLLTAKAYALSNGQSPEQLKANLLSGTIENAETYLAQVKLFTFIFIGGSIFITIVAFLILAFSRSVLWTHLLQQKLTVKLGRWSVLLLLEGVMLLLYIPGVMLLRYVLNLLLPISNEMIFSFINAMFYMAFAYAFLLLLFAIGFSFVHQYKVWESIGEGFSLLGKHKKALCIMLLGVVLVGVLLNLNLSLFLARVPFSPTAAAFLNVGIFLLIAAWLRVYFLQMVHIKN